MKILITGGLGFIGINSAKKMSENNEVYILDNFTRKGNLQNFNTLTPEQKIKVKICDIRNYFELHRVIKEINPNVILHLAGQVAVTNSVKNPREDFEINLIGTFNILECIREINSKCILIYSSTNKVYGDYKSEITESSIRYDYAEKVGVNELTPLDFHSPYGCSKGGADQYVRDYSRIYNLNTVVLRQSCIYGHNQFGIEDQGWVAWFTISSTFNRPFSIYGNGKQVRDILFVDDLIELYEKVISNINKCRGEIFNVGGGYSNSLSLLELILILEQKLKRKLNFNFSEWRPGDQKIYISDISKLENILGWKPKTHYEQGIDELYNWVKENEQTFQLLKLI